jgi:hypothetical protein
MVTGPISSLDSGNFASNHQIKHRSLFQQKRDLLMHVAQGIGLKANIAIKVSFFAHSTSNILPFLEIYSTPISR